MKKMGKTDTEKGIGGHCYVLYAGGNDSLQQ